MRGKRATTKEEGIEENEQKSGHTTIKIASHGAIVGKKCLGRSCRK